jgi:hypothetical protein
MKNIRSLLALACLAALAPFAKADTHQVTSLTTGAVKTILLVPANAQWITFANMGAGAVNMVLDSGAATGFTNTDPTTGATGIAQVVVPAASNGVPGFVALFVPSFFPGAQIRAIMQTGTTTLNLGVGMRNGIAVPAGTFPVN